MHDPPIHSPMAGDPEFEDLLEDFVADLPVRATRVHDHLVAGELEQAINVLHQLKGAAGIFGFMPIYEAAQIFEEQVKNQVDGTVELSKDLLELCKRATTDPQ